MPAAPHHSCRVLASPWPGVYATDIDSARHYGKHWHATYGLGLMDAGAHRSCSGHGAVEAHAGEIVTTNPGEVHDGRPLGGPSRRWRTVYLAPEIVASVHAYAGGGTGTDLAFTQAAFRDERLRAALLRLLRRLASWTQGARTRDAAEVLACEEALVHACGLMLRDHSTATGGLEPGDDAGFAIVLERLAASSLAAPSLGELATLAGLGRFQLLRRFKQAYGITPHAWLMQYRAERARSLVAQGMAIADAAAASGFADQSHLTRVFTQRFGFTPGAWRRALAPPRAPQ
jgi:AraC-like DNA-binding protein